jgi:hypothetical protein
LSVNDGALGEAGHLALRDGRFFEADALAEDAAQPEDEKQGDTAENNEYDGKTTILL